MIVRDEAAVLARSIKCALSVADEVIVVDTGSADDSKTIASSLGAKVYDFEWDDDFSAARNYSFSLASSDYVMWLDADDVFDGEAADKIRKLVRSGGFDVAMLPYVSGNICYMRERILKRSLNFQWTGAVHEVITPRGKIVSSDARITHKKEGQGNPMRNLFIYQKLIARGVCLDERQKFYYARELYYNNMFRQAIAVFRHFLAGDGWVVNKAEACRMLYYCHMQTGEEEEAKTCLVRAFLYLPPTSQDCCILASGFLKSGDLDSAEYWYKLALNCADDLSRGAFVDGDYSGYIPYLGLAVVCDRRGDFSSANDYNERAGAFKPDGEAYLYNKKYFISKLNKDNTNT